MYNLVRQRKVLGDMKYVISPVKQAAAAAGIWTEVDFDVKRVNELYTMVSGRFIFKRNKSFDSLIWSLVVSDMYTRRGCIFVEYNEDQ